MSKRIRNYFIAGLVVLFPVVGTYYIGRFLFDFADGFLRPLIVRLLHRHIPGLGLLLTVSLILFTGLLATNVLGRRLILMVDRILRRAPLINNIYNTFKQMVDAFINPTGTPFRRVVLVEYPRKGAYSIGFVTGENDGEVAQKTGKHMVNVFIVTTPNPTTGFLTLFPYDEITWLDMSVEEGLKMVISGGIIVPQAGERGSFGDGI